MNIKNFELENMIITNVIMKQESRGTVISVIGGVALISGLKRVKSEETLEFIGANNEISVKGIALNLNLNSVNAFRLMVNTMFVQAILAIDCYLAEANCSDHFK